MAVDSYDRTLKNGEAYKFKIDCLARCQQLKTEVSDGVDVPVWAVSGSSVTVSGETHDPTKPYALVTTATTGDSVVTITIKFDSGEISVITLNITVE